MSAKWQQWMPLQIDKWRGSPAVRAMHPAARSGYLDLLLAQWQMKDCSLSSDPLDLAEISGLGDELWQQYGMRIMRNFEQAEDGRVRNRVCFEEWQEAKRIFEINHCSPEELREKRSASGRKGNALRWAKIATDRKRDTELSQTLRKTSPTGTGTGTGTGTETRGEEHLPAPPPPVRISPHVDAGSELALAGEGCREIGIATNPGVIRAFAAEIVLLSDEGGTYLTAKDFIALQAREARCRGDTINQFWFSDQRYRPQAPRKTRKQRDLEEAAANFKLPDDL